MARPPLPLGTMGEIRTYPATNGRIKAIAQYRDHDGVTRQIERTGRSDTQARNFVREACRDRGRNFSAADITASTTVRALADKWIGEVAAAVKAGDRSPSTERLYRDRLENQVLPEIGALRLREVTVSRVDLLLQSVRAHRGAAIAKATRSVLSGMFRLAARHDAMPSNPVRDAATISGGTSEHRTLTLVEIWDLRAKLAADQRAIDRDLVDLVDLLMASGLRIGEASAITWPAVDFGAGTIEVRGTVLRITGKGVFIRWKPKSRAGWRVIELPSWAMAMLARRKADEEPNEWQAVFTSPEGRLRDPSNTQADLRDAFGRLGYPGVTSHTFRRTVATLMDGAGLTARAAADQLGHAKVSMTQDHYFGRRIARTGAAELLEAIDRRVAIGRENHG